MQRERGEGSGSRAGKERRKRTRKGAESGRRAGTARHANFNTGSDGTSSDKNVDRLPLPPLAFCAQRAEGLGARERVKEKERGAVA